jgi:NADH-quinone oxidoreductase subunit J
VTTRPRLETNKRQAVGLLAFVLFAVLAAVFLTADLGSGQGFPGGGSITASIGYAMFNLEGGAFPAEGFLVAFIVIAVVLDAALDAAVMLARREEGSEAFLPLRTDGSGDDEKGGDR